MAKATAAEAAQAIRDSKGFITTASKALGISRSQLHRMINKYPTVKEALMDAREEMKDFAESKIYTGIKDGNVALLIFYAKTQMKDRGYVEKQLTEQQSVNLEINLNDLTDAQISRLANGESLADVLKADD